MNKAIQLAIEKGGKKYIVLVDKADYYKVRMRSWHLTQNGYAIAWIDGKRTRMHHVILGKPPVGKEVDHINRNRLDNRRSNLHFVTSLQNGQNRKAVGFRKHGRGWEANVCLNYKKIFKSFPTMKAAKAWREGMKDKFLKTL